MVMEFEGRTEQEAIDAAVQQLGLDRHEFEVEILEQHKAGLFGLHRSVRIRVHLPGEDFPADEGGDVQDTSDNATGATTATVQSNRSARFGGNPEPETDFEHAVVDFVRTTTGKMGFPSTVQVLYREDGKLGLRLESEHANILIGRKGRNLDALQLLTNVVASRFADGDIKVVLDSEGYRGRREEQLIQLAHRVGDEVKRSRGSKLLEPMNPFERRLIHTALNDIADIGTESEGDGLYKQVRVFYRGGSGRR